MASVRAFLLGHSHMGAILRAVELLNPVPVREMGAFDAYFFDVWHNPEVLFHHRDVDGRLIFNHELGETMRRLGEGADRTVYITTFGGNIHLVLGMMEHPRPFDTVIPDQPDIPRKADAEFVPVGCLEGALSLYAQRYIDDLVSLRRHLPGDVYHLESPPPMGNDDHVQAQLDEYFKVNFKGQPLASRHLRYKMWRIQSGLVKRACLAEDIGFVAAPLSSMESDGFLLPEYYSPGDATHANGEYGKLVWAQVSEVCGGPLRSWHVFQ